MCDRCLSRGCKQGFSTSFKFSFHYRLKGYDVIVLQSKFEEFLAFSFGVTANFSQAKESEKLHGFMTFHFFYIQR